jgi:hypothetical protein
MLVPLHILPLLPHVPCTAAVLHRHTAATACTVSVPMPNYTPPGGIGRNAAAPPSAQHAAAAAALCHTSCCHSPSIINQQEPSVTQRQRLQRTLLRLLASPASHASPDPYYAAPAGRPCF